MNKNTIQHYERMGQRTDILFEKAEGQGKIDFMENMLNEHLGFYTKQGFSIDEANKLITISTRVRDFFGLEITSELYRLLDRGNYNDFFEALKSYFEDTTNVFGAFELEALFQQMTGRKEIPETKEGIKKYIQKIMESGRQKGKEEIQDVLKNLSYYYFENGGQKMSTAPVPGREVIIQIEKFSEEV